MFVFREIWRGLFSFNLRFEICPFILLPTNSSKVGLLWKVKLLILFKFLALLLNFFFWNGDCHE